MPATLGGLPYPSPADAADSPYWLQRLAESVDSSLLPARDATRHWLADRQTTDALPVGVDASVLSIPALPFVTGGVYAVSALAVLDYKAITNHTVGLRVGSTLLHSYVISAPKTDCAAPAPLFGHYVHTGPDASLTVSLSVQAGGYANIISGTRIRVFRVDPGL